MAKEETNAQGTTLRLESGGLGSILEAPRSAPGASARPALTPQVKSYTDRPLQVAIVGAGFIADFHLAILKDVPGVEVAVIVDPDRARAEALAQRFDVARVETSIGALKDAAIDVAHLLVPPDLHVKLTEELFALGIGAFVEKPVALSGDEARGLAESARTRGLPLGGNHNNLHHPAFLRVMQRIEAGEIGRVEHVQVTLSVPLMQLDAGDFAHWMFRTPKNIVYEQAVHPLCWVHALVGRLRGVQTTLLGTRELNPGQKFVDRWSISGQGERGTMQMYLAFGQGFTRTTLNVIGSDGSLEADIHHNAVTGETKSVYLDFWNSFLATHGRGKALKRDARAVVRDYLKFTLGLGRREDAFFAGMRGSIQSFYKALASGAPLPTDGAQAAEVLDWCDAIAAAAPAAAPPAAALPAPCAPRAREVVVLGATGFIGRRTVAKLLEANLPVSIVARRAHALPPEIEAAIRDGRVRFLRASLEDKAALTSVLSGAHTVIQLATGGGDTWEKVQRSMVDGTRDVAEAALAHGVKRFVYVSSIAALYTGRDAPEREITDSTDVDPEPEQRPLYSRGKMAAEAVLLSMHRARELPLVIVRPGVVMGAGTLPQHSGLGLWQRDNHCIGWGLGDNPLPIVWVDDVADALRALARYEKDDLHGQALNLCAKTTLTAQECVAELARVTGRNITFHPRGLGLSQMMEIGKYCVKKAGRRPGVEFPSWRDLKSRALVTTFACDLARAKLGWKPVEEREALLERCVRVYKPRS
ncbi:MAG: NAD-dependent epimerase/dehydratase family protein [Planctomycetes bacterium]|nr:NAD-dependent epimerase/dehydratase family protein [Planctomycetota bacterium]